MKLAVQYVSDANATTQSVLLPIGEWKKILTKLKKLEQVQKLSSDLEEAMQEVRTIKNGGGKKQTLKDFLNEL